LRTVERKQQKTDWEEKEERDLSNVEKWAGGKLRALRSQASKIKESLEGKLLALIKHVGATNGWVVRGGKKPPSLGNGGTEYLRLDIKNI